MANRHEIGVIICGHVGIGCTVLAEMMYRHNQMEAEIIIINGNGTQEEPKKEFEFRNKIPIEIIQVADLPIDFLDREPRYYGKQTKLINNYLNYKKKYRTLRRNDRVLK